MNQKKAKKIRALAKLLIGKMQQENPNASFENRYIENTARRKKQHVYQTDEQGNAIIGPDGNPIVKNTFDVSTGTITLARDCYRGIYRAMKKREAQTA